MKTIQVCLPFMYFRTIWCSMASSLSLWKGRWKPSQSFVEIFLKLESKVYSGTFWKYQETFLSHMYTDSLLEMPIRKRYYWFLWKNYWKYSSKICIYVPFKETSTSINFQIRPIVAGFKSVRDKENILRHTTSSKILKQRG